MLLWVPGDERSEGGSAHPDARFGDLEWADGIAFGTPVGDGRPAAALMGFIEATEPLWSSGWLHDKVVTVFTDEPEHFAPDSVLHSIYDALYHWGAVIVGPRAFELASDAQRRHGVSESGGPLSASRLKVRSIAPAAWPGSRECWPTSASCDCLIMLWLACRCEGVLV
jgi:NAD(P)H dehydrogenase (quinone)